MDKILLLEPSWSKMRLNHSVFLVGKLVWAPGKVGNGVLGDVWVPNGSLIIVL